MLPKSKNDMPQDFRSKYLRSISTTEGFVNCIQQSGRMASVVR
jgi:hypothetical protein